MPALIVDPALRSRVASSPRRAAFYCGAVASLAASLASRGTQLIVRRGPLLGTARALAREVGADTVAWSASYDAVSVTRERKLQATLEEAGLRVLIAHDAPAVAPDDTAAERSEGGIGYRALAPYLAAWETRATPPVEATIRFSGERYPSEALPAESEYGTAALAEPPSEERSSRALDAFLEGPAQIGRAHV